MAAIGKKLSKRSRIKSFAKAYNYNHHMPTRYSVGMVLDKLASTRISSKNLLLNTRPDGRPRSSSKKGTRKKKSPLYWIISISIQTDSHFSHLKHKLSTLFPSPSSWLPFRTKLSESIMRVYAYDFQFSHSLLNWIYSCFYSHHSTEIAFAAVTSLLSFKGLKTQYLGLFMHSLWYSSHGFKYQPYANDFQIYSSSVPCLPISVLGFLTGSSKVMCLNPNSWAASSFLSTLPPGPPTVFPIYSK